MKKSEVRSQDPSTGLPGSKAFKVLAFERGGWCRQEADFDEGSLRERHPTQPGDRPSAYSCLGRMTHFLIIKANWV